MTDLTITASQVRPNGCAIGDQNVVAGEALTAGELTYLDGSTSPPTWKLAAWKLADTTYAGVQSTIGICLDTSVTSGQPVKIATGGAPILGAGAAPAVGVAYFASSTPGGIASGPVTSLAPVVLVGIGGTSNTLIMPPNGVWQTGQLAA